MEHKQKNESTRNLKTLFNGGIITHASLFLLCGLAPELSSNPLFHLLMFISLISPFILSAIFIWNQDLTLISDREIARHKAKKKRSRMNYQFNTGDLLFVWTLVYSAGVLFAFNMPSYLGLFPWSISIGFLTTMILLIPNLHFNFSSKLYLVIYALGYGWISTIYLNSALDRSPMITLSMKLTEKSITHKGKNGPLTQPHLTFSLIETAQGTISEHSTPELYQKVKTGETYHIQAHPGALNMPWMKQIQMLEEKDLSHALN